MRGYFFVATTAICFISCFFFMKLFGLPRSYQIDITGIFPDEETIIFIINSDEQFKVPVKLSPNKKKQTVSFSIPYQKTNPIKWINIQFQNGLQKDIWIEQIRIQNMVVIKPDDIIKYFYDASNYNIEVTKYQHADATYCCLHKLKKEDYIYLIFFIPELISNSSPIGLQLFLRLSSLAILFIFLFILTKQAPTQHFLLFTIALFLISLPLKINYTNCTMAFMSLTMIIAFIRNKSRHFTWQPIFYVLCAIYLMNVIGLLYTGDFKLGTRRLDTIIVLLIFPVIFSMVQFPKKSVILLLRFFVWLVIIFCTFGLLSYVTIVPGMTWDMVYKDSKLYAPLLMMWPAHPHPSYVSTILLMAVPIALYLRFQDGRQITFIEMLLGVSLPIVFTMLGGARVGMMIAPLLLGLGYLFYCRFRPALKWGLVVVGIAAVAGLLQLFPKADDRFVDPVRVDLRRTAISAVKERPVLGWGTGYVSPLIRSEERAHHLGIETPHPLDRFHNQYLEDVVQFGIPGILILLTLIAWVLWLGIQNKDYLLLSFLAIYVIFFWTESALYNSKGVVPFAFWLCFLVATQKTRLSKETTTA